METYTVLQNLRNGEARMVRDEEVESFLVSHDTPDTEWIRYSESGLGPIEAGNLVDFLHPPA